MSEYAIVIENDGDAWEAYAPDFPRMGVLGSNEDEVERRIVKLISETIAALDESGEQAPQPKAKVRYVSVAQVLMPPTEAPQRANGQVRQKNSPC